MIGLSDNIGEKCMVSGLVSAVEDDILPFQHPGDVKRCPL